MQKQTLFLFLLLVALMAVSCVTSRTIENEERMEAWLGSAALPVTVMFQSNELLCKPTLYCYTLIDASGKVHYARNVRHRLPRIIPEDSAMLRRPVLERIFGGN